MSEIELRNVEKRYGSVQALDGVSLSIARGETVGLIGRNGAGKTTLFKMLVGHETPDSGSVSVRGLAPEAGAALRERVGYLPERASFPPSFTGREVVAFHARTRGVENENRRVERVLGTVGLADAADRRVEGYSNGMHRRLGLATALVGDPDVLLLDEPTAALDPAGVEDFHRVVEALAEETDITVLVTSHVLSEVERLCERVVVLDDGAVEVEGDVEDLRRETEETVSVTVRAADPERARDAVGTVEGVSEIETGPSRVRVECRREAVFDVLDALREATDVASVEIEEAGLDAVFRDALEVESDVALSGVER